MYRKGSTKHNKNDPNSKKSTEKNKSKEENKRVINTSKELPDLEVFVYVLSAKPRMHHRQHLSQECFVFRTHFISLNTLC